VVVEYERLFANLPCLHSVTGPSVPRMRMLTARTPNLRSLKVAMGRFTHEERSRQGVNVDLSDQGALGQPRMPISWPGNDLDISRPLLDLSIVTSFGLSYGIRYLDYHGRPELAGLADAAEEVLTFSAILRCHNSNCDTKSSYDKY
jgi:hypothetical protein